jgi:hypothetical protein
MTDRERTVGGVDQVPGLPRGRISEHRVAMTVDALAASIAAERHRHELEKTR